MLTKKPLLNPAFSTVVAVYDDASWVQQDVLYWLLDFLPEKQVDSVLDIGSATGKGTALLKQRFLPTLCRGIDVSSSMVDYARQQYPCCQFDCVGVESLTSTAAADLVFSNATLHWVHD